MTPTLERVHPLAGSSFTVRVSPSDAVVHAEQPFTNAQGLSINSQSFSPPGDAAPRAAMLVLHGMNTHAGYSFATFDYEYAGSITERYVKAGLAVHTIDYQGFGKSEGVGRKRGHIKRIAHIVADVLQLCAAIKEQRPNTPLYIHGQSFGGAVATWVCQEAPAGLLAGAVLTVPNIALAPEAMPSALIVNALRLIAALAPAYQLLAPPEDSDADFQFRFASDPYCYAKPLRASWCNQLRLMYHRFAKRGSLARVRLPFILFQPTHDDFCNPEGAYSLYETSESTDKTLVALTNMGHAPITEDGCDEVISMILGWIDERAGKAAEAAPAKAEKLELTVKKKGAEAAERLTVAGMVAAIKFKGKLERTRKSRKEARRCELRALRG